MSRPDAAGHRAIGHTADVRIESWGPSRDAALAEAVTALAASYARWPAGAVPVKVVVEMAAGSDEELLVAVLDEAVFLADARGLVAVAARVAGGVATFACLPASTVDVVGACPKGVAWNDLVCAATDDGWRCAATIDV